MMNNKNFRTHAELRRVRSFFCIYDTQGNIVRSIDMTAEKEYNYMYENGTLVRSAEYDITIENELVTVKSLVSSVRYSYDSEGTLEYQKNRSLWTVLFCLIGNCIIPPRRFALSDQIKR